MSTELERLVRLGRSLYERGLSPGRTGNLSILHDGEFLMTPTGASLGDLDADRISVLDSDGRHIRGPAPTKEYPLHLACYRREPAIRAVAHVHSTFATAVSLLADVDPGQALPWLTPYFVMRVGALPLLPYRAPGAGEAAGDLGALVAGVRCALMSNHGSIAMAESIDAAVDAIEEIEEASKLHFILGDRNTRGLPPAEITRLMSAKLAGTVPASTAGATQE